MASETKARKSSSPEVRALPCLDSSDVARRLYYPYTLQGAYQPVTTTIPRLPVWPLSSEWHTIRTDVSSTVISDNCTINELSRLLMKNHIFWHILASYLLLFSFSEITIVGSFAWMEPEQYLGELDGLFFVAAALA